MNVVVPLACLGVTAPSAIDVDVVVVAVVDEEFVLLVARPLPPGEGLECFFSDFTLDFFLDLSDLEEFMTSDMEGLIVAPIMTYGV